MTVLDEQRSIHEPHAKTIYPRSLQAGGPDQITDTTAIFFDTVYLFDIFNIFDIDDINAVEQAESPDQDARR